MDLGLRGRRALVTGASSGLGLACAQALAAEGASVAIVARSADRLAAAALTFGADADLVQIVGDVAEPGRVDAIVAATQAAFGGIDIVIANAGGPPVGGFADIDLALYEPALRLNLLSTIEMCKATVPAMQARRWGRVVAITSISAREPIDRLILSNTARAGLTAFLKTLAREVAADGVTVNSLQPGLHATDRLRTVYGDGLSAAAAEVPTGTIGHPGDFGRLAAFLCSDSARFVTGSSLPVDGGASRGLQ